VLFAILIIVWAGARELSLPKSAHDATTWACSAIDRFSVLIAIFVGVNLRTKSSLKTSITILPKPIARWQVLREMAGQDVTRRLQIVVMGVVWRGHDLFRAGAALAPRSPRR